MTVNQELTAKIISKDQLLSYLKANDIEFKLYEHPPLFTCEDAKKIYHDIPGPHVKNLFLRNKKKTEYLLVTVKDHKRVDLIALGERLNLGRLSFASNDDLQKILAVQPGSVTPLAFINDEFNKVKLFIDSDLLAEENISIHPMENTATISIKLSDLILFLGQYKREKPSFIAIP